MGNMKCEKIKELINLEIDGMLDEGLKTGLLEHLKACSDCARVYNEFKLMAGAVRSIEFIEPAYLESKINAAVIQSQKSLTRPVFAKKLIPAMGLSFMTVIAAAFFIIYNDKGQKNNIQTASVISSAEPKILANVPDVKKSAVNKNAAAEIKKETESNNIINEETKGFVKYEAPVYENRMVKASVLKQEQSAAAKVAENTDESKPVFSAAKDEGTPTPGTGILDREKAVIANNVINPNTGMAATIKFKVEETSRVKITVYDKAVRVVAVLLDTEKQPGVYEVPWNGKTDGNVIVRDGVYFVTIQIGKQVIKRNIVVSKNF